MKSIELEINKTLEQDTRVGQELELELSCDYMEHDRIERFLGIDPQAGLQRTLSWALSGSYKLKKRAIVVLPDINDPAARQALEGLSHDSDTFLADLAKEALADPSFFLALNSQEVVALAGKSAVFTVNQTAINKFGDPVSYSVTGLPNGVTAKFAPASLCGSGATTLTIHTAPTVAAGTYKPAVVAVDIANPSYTRSIGLTLTVQAGRSR